MPGGVPEGYGSLNFLSFKRAWLNFVGAGAREVWTESEPPSAI